MISKAAVTQKLREILADVRAMEERTAATARQIEERVKEVAAFCGQDVLTDVLADDPDHARGLMLAEEALAQVGRPPRKPPRQVLPFKPPGAKAPATKPQGD